MLPIALTPGDPLGIGPEVTLRALSDCDVIAEPVVLVGDWAALDRANHQLDALLPLTPVDRFTPSSQGIAVYDPGATPGLPVEAGSIQAAVRAIQSDQAAALVTGPIHKQKLAEQGFAFAGHTGYLGHLCGVANPVMAFVGGTIRVALVTTHVPLRQVAEHISLERVLHTLVVCDRALRTDLGLSNPRLLVCGLNPHAGDGGLLGHEEREVIGPACDNARALGIRAEGPMGAEEAFYQAQQGQGELVVAMYHDQGLAPLKRIDFGQCVNWTLGLPIVRTSVDHGTAYNLAGTGRARASSMSHALRLAWNLVRQRTCP